ncbi:hypothetical protein [Croceicoccus mobilis]|uniref:Uncharacterized protein n=1 Tax=Croceicoccus mobilis TaxID=1703339 RepID=A0A916YT36_9SPHN|nr:hypothetical protein [Croceicoccus mobilis]GGD58723.1 hypothetical protein GCM10010990_04960 [Croceicoccus mobilis]
MPRTQNFYYQRTPTTQVAGSLAKALFGDPAARAAQAQRDAELEQMQARARASNAQAELYSSQEQGQAQQNAAAASLPELMARMGTAEPQPAAAPAPQMGFADWLGGGATLPATAAAAPPVENDLLAGTPMAGPVEQPAAQPVGMQASLPQVLAQMAIMNGEGVDPRQIIGTYAAMLGNDEMARRSLVVQGKTPGENFALTAGRADDISARDAAEDYRKSTGVATINHANDIPVANIRAGATRDAASIRASATRDVANIREKGMTSRAAAKNGTGADGKPLKPVNSATLKMIDAELMQQLGELGYYGDGATDQVSGGTINLLRRLAVERYRGSGDPSDAVRASIKQIEDRRDEMNRERGIATDEFAAPPPPVVQTRRRGAPSLRAFLMKARAANPAVSDAELTRYYNEKYGS